MASTNTNTTPLILITDETISDAFGLFQQEKTVFGKQRTKGLPVMLSQLLLLFAASKAEQATLSQLTWFNTLCATHQKAIEAIPTDQRLVKLFIPIMAVSLGENVKSAKQRVDDTQSKGHSLAKESAMNLLTILHAAKIISDTELQTWVVQVIVFISLLGIRAPTKLSKVIEKTNWLKNYATSGIDKLWQNPKKNTKGSGEMMACVHALHVAIESQLQVWQNTFFIDMVGVDSPQAIGVYSSRNEGDMPRSREDYPPRMMLGHLGNTLTDPVLGGIPFATLMQHLHGRVIEHQTPTDPNTVHTSETLMAHLAKGKPIIKPTIAKRRFKAAPPPNNSQPIKPQLPFKLSPAVLAIVLPHVDPKSMPPHIAGLISNTEKLINGMVKQLQTSYTPAHPPHKPTWKQKTPFGKRKRRRH